MIRIRVRDQWDRAGHGIWIIDDRPDGFYIAQPVQLTFEKAGDKEGAFRLPDPTLELSYEQSQAVLQGIADELARLGIRSNSDKTAGTLEAQTKHLDREKEQVDRLFNMLADTMRLSLIPPFKRS